MKVSGITLDPAGARLVTGGYDFEVCHHVWMTGYILHVKLKALLRMPSGKKVCYAVCHKYSNTAFRIF